MGKYQNNNAHKRVSLKFFDCTVSSFTNFLRNDYSGTILSAEHIQENILSIKINLVYSEIRTCDSRTLVHYTFSLYIHNLLKWLNLLFHEPFNFQITSVSATKQHLTSLLSYCIKIQNFITIDFSCTAIQSYFASLWEINWLRINTSCDLQRLNIF